MKKQTDEISIGDLMDVFIPKLWLIVIVGILFGAALGLRSMFLVTDTYTTTAQMVMNKIPTVYSEEVTNSPHSTGINANEIAAMQSLINMSEDLMHTNDFLSKVKEKLVEKNSSYSSVNISTLKSMLSISIVGEETIFTIKSVSTDKQLGYDAVGVVFDLLPGVIIDTFSSYAIQIKPVDAAGEPVHNSKNVVRNTAVGFIGGALLSMAIIFIIFKLDVMVRSKERLEECFDIPVIGVIPHLETMD